MKGIGILLTAICMGLSPGIANGATALLVGGYGQYATLTDEEMATAFGGYFADYTRVNVPFPGTSDMGYSIQQGTTALYDTLYATYAALQQAGGPIQIVIGGVSEGAPSVDEVLRKLASDPNPPSRDELRAMIYADPGRQRIIWGSKVGSYTYQPPPDTQYDVTVVKAEYDGMADWPDKWLNLIAVVNAVMGASQLHVAKAYTDLNTVPAADITTTTSTTCGAPVCGTTTTYLIPTPILPLLKPGYDAGWSPSFLAALDRFFRPIIDSAYDRPVPTQAPVAPAAAPMSAVAPAPAPAPTSASASTSATVSVPARSTVSSRPSLSKHIPKRSGAGTSATPARKSAAAAAPAATGVKKAVRDKPKAKADRADASTRVKVSRTHTPKSDPKPDSTGPGD